MASTSAWSMRSISARTSVMSRHRSGGRMAMAVGLLLASGLLFPAGLLIAARLGNCGLRALGRRPGAFRGKLLHLALGLQGLEPRAILARRRPLPLRRHRHQPRFHLRVAVRALGSVALELG